MSTRSYAQTLRAIGQALETARLETFELQQQGQEYSVRGETLVQVAVNPPGPEPQRIWQKFKGGASSSSDVPAPQTVRELVELHYTASDIARLEDEGQSRRRDGHTMPDAYSPSQLLRAAGAYLDRKRARLQQLSKQDGTIKLRYETSLGSATEELTVAYLYDMAVRLYLRRSDRAREQALG
ncbi:MAG TPA: hypothetical protein VNL14_13035 [Candidatus Acidoferrales bacterium]|nr:hypothetical protein [Candidatus Acidoferrales bacterium]